jgi:hypothetical protein
VIHRADFRVIAQPAYSTLKIYEADLNRCLDRLTSLIPTHKASGKLENIIKKVRRHLFVFVINRDLTATNNGSARAARSTAKSPTAFGAPRSTPTSIGRRNRAAKIDPSHRPHPPHPRKPPLPCAA